MVALEEGLGTGGHYIKVFNAHTRALDEDVKRNAFGDAGQNGIYATLHAVLGQTSGGSKGLVTARARLVKQ